MGSLAKFTLTFMLFLAGSFHLSMAQNMSNSTVKKVNQAEAESYIWGKESQGWHYLKSDALSIIRENVPPGESEVMHYHKIAKQFFYVLKGTATMALESSEIVLQQGDGLEVPAGVWHQFINHSTNDVEILVISTPKSHGDKYTK